MKKKEFNKLIDSTKAAIAHAEAANKVKPVLSLNVKADNDELLEVKVIDDSRFVNYGFGTFLEEYKPEEVEITDDAREKLLACSYKSGLQGMEFFEPNTTGFNILAWGDTSKWIAIPFIRISVHGEGARQNIKNFAKK